jgi:hypothetical protein
MLYRLVEIKANVLMIANVLKTICLVNIRKNSCNSLQQNSFQE